VEKSECSELSLNALVELKVVYMQIKLMTDRICTLHVSIPCIHHE
jgi:hypothetical protein